jgi:hypothetical protein
MPSYLRNIGFALSSPKDIAPYIKMAFTSGQRRETAHGICTNWDCGNRVELWVYQNRDEVVMDFAPHFRGRGLTKVRLTDRIERPQSGLMRGAFRGWGDPFGDKPDFGTVQLGFDVPDFEFHRSLQLPAMTTVQLTAFADDVKAFPNDQSFLASQGDIKFAPESFVPGSFLLSDGRNVDIPDVYAFLSGHVLRTEMVTNPASKQRFCWAIVRAFNGEIDVVADPALVKGRIVPGGVISGIFWLSGLLAPV